MLCVALRCFERRRRHLDGNATAVLPAALAALTNRDRNLIRRTCALWRGSAIDHHSREHAQKLSVTHPLAAFALEDLPRLPQHRDRLVVDVVITQPAAPQLRV